MAEFDFQRSWKDLDFVAFDTEASGAYPLGYDIVEFGAVRWRAGQIVDEMQTLIKPREKMSDFIIGIHGITNEMVESAPSMGEVIAQIHQFFEGSVVMAHHAPFDVGFMVADFEKYDCSLPSSPVLCTSLLSRKLIHGPADHRLQTLIRFLDLPVGTAHRALDDARACLQVGLRCFGKLESTATLQDLINCQGNKLDWKNFRVRQDPNPVVQSVIEAVEKKLVLDIVYGAKAERRQIKPIGLVRNPDGDFVYALCLQENSNKRFFLSKFKDSVVVY